MSRFDLYGGNYCRKCKWYGPVGTDGPHARCHYPENLRTNWLGIIYIKHPDELNWNRRCGWYEEDDK